MRVAFSGFRTCGLISLRAALEGGHDTAIVLTHPDEQEYYYSFNDSVAEFSRSQGLPVEVRRGTEADIPDVLHAARPDAILCSNWRWRLAPEAVSTAAVAAVNAHRALLPRYGGLAPINWAVARGETRTGVTLHAIDEDMDLGDIFGQQQIDIGPDETATDIFHKMTPVIQRLVLRVLDDLETGNVTRRAQNSDEATFFHKRGERETRIDWTKRRDSVYALIRHSPNPSPVHPRSTTVTA